MRHEGTKTRREATERPSGNPQSAIRDPQSRGSALRPPPFATGGFTLIEMIVVVGLVLVLVGLLMPAASTLWEQRKMADAENTLQGLFMTARSRALQARGGQTGLFFFLDRDGTQRILALEQAFDKVNPASRVLLDVFRVSENRQESLPVPMRAVPRYIVDRDQTGPSDDADTFSDEELINNSFENPPNTANVGQRHRNFFSLIFTTEGQLLARRDVLIRDNDDNADGLGDRTGLPVGRGPGVSPIEPAVQRYLPQTGAAEDIDPDGIPPPETVDNLISVPGASAALALNFPSADGVLIYDDALLNHLRAGDPATDGPAFREFLLRSAQPFYISRLTGAVIRGPVAEHIEP